MRYVGLFILMTLAACTMEVDTMKQLNVTSPAFMHNQPIPATFTCDGKDINPPLDIRGVPENTVSMALIVDDPDAPRGTWVHWVVWNIAPMDTIEQDTIPGTQGMNDFRREAYGGPCPPSGTHRYFFKVYALDTELNLDGSARKKDVEHAMEGHILAKGELIGLYSRR